MKVITTLTTKDTKEFVKNKILYYTEANNDLNENLYNKIKDILHKKTGIEGCVYSVSRIDESEVCLERNKNELEDYLEYSDGYFVFELDTYSDLCISISQYDLINLNNKFESCKDFELDLLYMELEDSLAKENGRHMITFLPLIDGKDCTKFKMVESDWSTKEIDLKDENLCKTMRLNII